MDRRPPVVVLPPAPDGGRRVTIHGERMGTAYNLFDVLDFLHQAGLPSKDTAVDDPELIEWRGGGPYDWNNTALRRPQPMSNSSPLVGGIRRRRHGRSPSPPLPRPTRLWLPGPGRPPDATDGRLAPVAARCGYVLDGLSLSSAEDQRAVRDALDELLDLVVLAGILPPAAT